MKKAEKVITIISLILALVLTCCTMVPTKINKEISKGQPTIEEYFSLREETLNYAKTLEINKNDENIIILKTEIKDDYIIITTIKEYRCKIKATYPIIKNTDGSFKINYEKGLYETKSQADFILLLLLWVLVNIFYKTIIYYNLYLIVWSCKKIIEKIKKIITIIKAKHNNKKEKKDSK